MTRFPQDTEPKSWHRYFAMEFNDRAWDFAERASRTAEETIEMLNAAHAAAAHWNLVGTDLNRMRARTLLAHRCALAGFGEFALQLAEEVRLELVFHPARRARARCRSRRSRIK